MGDDAAVRARTRDEDTTKTQRRCINRSCGRYWMKLDHGRCHSCGRSTRWSPTAFLFIVAKSLR